jgi:hypothetical protein
MPDYVPTLSFTYSLNQSYSLLIFSQLIMGIIRTAFLTSLCGVGGGVASIGAGMAYLSAGTTLVNLTRDDPWLKSKVYGKYNPKANPACMDDCIKRVPLSKIRPDLRDNEEALALEFCRGIWSRWGMEDSPCRVAPR